MNAFVTLLATFAGAYVAGSLPTAYLIARWLCGIDIRAVGSCNPGAVNVWRHVGPWAGLAVLVIDATKGAAAVLVAQSLDLGDGSAFAGALGAVAGHNWPVFLGFRGGKGVAVILGVSLVMLPLWTVVAIAGAIAAGLVTRSVVFGIGAGIITLNALIIGTGQGAAQISLCLVLSAIVIGTHYAAAYPQVLEAVRRRGAWGLFEPE